MAANRNLSTEKKLTPEILQRFAQRFKGELILPEDRGHSRVRRVWNYLVNQYPQIIVHRTDSDDVILVVELARNHHELSAAVRAGGHSFAGYGICDNGIVIDLSPMKQTGVDPAMKLAE